MLEEHLLLVIMTIECGLNIGILSLQKNGNEKVGTGDPGCC